MKVVFDTHIFVLAFVMPGSRANALLRRIIDDIDQLIVSRPIIDEPLIVRAKKIARDADELARVAVFLSGLARGVRPGDRVDVLEVEADNHIFVCARTGRADLIVSGNKAMLELCSYRNIKIIFAGTA